MTAAEKQSRLSFVVIIKIFLWAESVLIAQVWKVKTLNLSALEFIPFIVFKKKVFLGQRWLTDYFWFAEFQRAVYRLDWEVRNLHEFHDRMNKKISNLLSSTNKIFTTRGEIRGLTREKNGGGSQTGKKKFIGTFFFFFSFWSL